MLREITAVLDDCIMSVELSVMLPDGMKMVQTQYHHGPESMAREEKASFAEKRVHDLYEEGQIYDSPNLWYNNRYTPPRRPPYITYNSFGGRQL